jgi:heme exporter protein C
MNKWWWKILSIVLLAYTLTAGFGLFWKNDVPRLPQLNETIRNLYFHVCMWFAMMILFTYRLCMPFNTCTNKLKHDIISRQYAAVGIIFGMLGYATGAIWMSYTWADPNEPAIGSFKIAKEPKLIGAAIALLIYFAYLVFEIRSRTWIKKQHQCGL